MEQSIQTEIERGNRTITQTDAVAWPDFCEALAFSRWLQIKLMHLLVAKNSAPVLTFCTASVYRLIVGRSASAAGVFIKFEERRNLAFEFRKSICFARSTAFCFSSRALICDTTRLSMTSLHKL